MSGSALVRSMAGRLRGWLANRRRAPRYKARLPLSVSLGPARGAAAGSRRQVEGYARDISAYGIGLVLPSVPVGDRPPAGERGLLHIRLPLKTEGITISAVPVRYQPLGLEEEGGYVVGARIEGMDEGDRALLARHMKRLRLRVKDHAP